MEIGRLLLARYEIQRHLAGGAMSTVWVARDQVSEQEVAIKAISLDSAGWRAEVRDRFQKEARLLALSAHENLVGVRGSGETDDGYLFLVLDLVIGETLADRLAREPHLTWQEAVALALGISRGVAALHARGIVHRDLKPANIILEDRGGEIVPKIIDLGIGKVLDTGDSPGLSATLTATGQVLGTPQYMSYEQALGARDVDARSDVWALGAVLYEMLAWRRPFHAPNVNAVLAAIRRQDGPRLGEVAPGVPGELAAIVDRCMQKERSERFQDAGALAVELEGLLERAARGFVLRSTPPPGHSSQPPSAPGPSPAGAANMVRGGQTEKPAPDRRALRMIVGGVLLGAGIILGMVARGALSRQRSGPPSTSGEGTTAPVPAAWMEPHGPALVERAQDTLPPEVRAAAPVASGDSSSHPAAAGDAGAHGRQNPPKREPTPRGTHVPPRSSPVTRVNDSGL